MSKGPQWKSGTTSAKAWGLDQYVGRETRTCSGCGFEMTRDEIWWDSTASLAGWSPTDQNYDREITGGFINTGEVLCEYCYKGKHEADTYSGSYDFTDPDEVEDPWALDEDHEWFYPG